jgi:hypothetical protein
MYFRLFKSVFAVLLFCLLGASVLFYFFHAEFDCFNVFRKQMLVLFRNSLLRVNLEDKTWNIYEVDGLSWKVGKYLRRDAKYKAGDYRVVL